MSNLLCVLTVSSLLLLSGCEGCDGGADAEGSEAPRSVVEGQEERLTVDGYEVVGLNNTTRVEASSNESARAERERSQLVLEPTSPDPHAGSFTLQEAVDGMPEEGKLVAEIRTDLGTIFCDLFADRVPNTVANFIGLARGKRAWWDARAGAWVTRPLYSGTKFHRVVPGYLIQGGDPLDDGTGAVGYTLEDEPHESLQHDRAGQLCMTDNGDNGRVSQFFITDGPARQLDSSSDYTIFGQCTPLQTIQNIARVPQRASAGNRPITDVEVTRILVRRQVGGAAEASPSPPTLPEGFDWDRPSSGASRGPSEAQAFPGRAPNMVTMPEGIQRARDEAIRRAQEAQQE